MFIVKYNSDGMTITNVKSGRQLGGCGPFVPTSRIGHVTEMDAFAGTDAKGAAVIEAFYRGRLRWQPEVYGWRGDWTTEDGREKFRAALRTWHAAYVGGGIDAANGSGCGIRVTALDHGG
jgi:hypothetical protein